MELLPRSVIFAAALAFLVACVLQGCGEDAELEQKVDRLEKIEVNDVAQTRQQLQEIETVLGDMRESQEVENETVKSLTNDHATLLNMANDLSQKQEKDGDSDTIKAHHSELQAKVDALQTQLDKETRKVNTFQKELVDVKKNEEEANKEVSQKINTLKNTEESNHELLRTEAKTVQELSKQVEAIKRRQERFDKRLKNTSRKTHHRRINVEVSLTPNREAAGELHQSQTQTLMNGMPKPNVAKKIRQLEVQHHMQVAPNGSHSHTTHVSHTNGSHSRTVIHANAKVGPTAW